MINDIVKSMIINSNGKEVDKIKIPKTGSGSSLSYLVSFESTDYDFRKITSTTFVKDNGCFPPAGAKIDSDIQSIGPNRISVEVLVDEEAASGSYYPEFCTSGGKCISTSSKESPGALTEMELI